MAGASGAGTREEPGAPVFPGSSRLGIEPRVAGARPNHQADRGSDPNHRGIERTVVRGLGIFVFMKNRLEPVKSWKPVFKQRNSATLKKGHSIQVNINPTFQKCEH